MYIECKILLNSIKLFEHNWQVEVYKWILKKNIIDVIYLNLQWMKYRI